MICDKMTSKTLVHSVSCISVLNESVMTVKVHTLVVEHEDKREILDISIEAEQLKHLNSEQVEKILTLIQTEIEHK